MLRGKWWEIYQDPQLNQLEERIATDNQPAPGAGNLSGRARPGRCGARQSLSHALRRTVITRNKRLEERPLRTQQPTATSYNDLALAGQASWEPDFWGRIRRTVEPARANAQASAADMANVDLSLHAELAADYFQLRGLDSEIKLLNATVTDLEKPARPDPAPA